MLITVHGGLASLQATDSLGKSGPLSRCAMDVHPEEVPLLEVVLPDPLLLLLPLLLPLPLLLLLGAAFFLAGAFTTGSFAMGSAVRNTAAAAASRDLLCVSRTQSATQKGCKDENSPPLSVRQQLCLTYVYLAVPDEMQGSLCGTHRVDQPAIRLGSPNRPSVVWY